MKCVCKKQFVKISKC